jgi:3-dehydro-L-gulonate 2-dehydrogenase
MLRVSYEELFGCLQRALLRLGFEQQRAQRCAQLFAETTRDGVYSHGLKRFPRFVAMIHNGSIDIHAVPESTSSSGPLERWNGRFGPGNLNAYQCMERAIVLAREHGMGCVALADTNHWMRGGTYGWQAADAGVIGICWTNTLRNLPPWGAADARLGNNPLVIAVPKLDGHVVLDMAMSQFSYGALASYRERGELLPVAGGFDQQGRLTRDPGAIEATNRPLPIGFWKGSGLALMLDLLAAILSGGKASRQISTDPELESGISQVFIAFDPARLGQAALTSQIAGQVIEHFQLGTCSGGERVRYPGEQVLRIRKENLANGVPVDPALWRELQAV